MSNYIPPVYHQTLESMIGTTWSDYSGMVKRIQGKMKEDDLLVHVVVLAHGTDPSRMDSTAAMLRMLSEQVQSERVKVWLSYQGDKMPAKLKAATKIDGLEVITQTSEDSQLDDLPSTGKTENILRALKTIYDRDFLPPERQFVVFLDNDYVLYDAINVHSLYIPWVVNPYRSEGPSRDQLYIKAGGMRLKLSESMQSGKWLGSNNAPAKFSELCRESLQQAGFDSKVLDQAEALIPTYDTLIEVLGPSAVENLESALDLTTRHGARSSRGLSCYLQARRDNPTARFLSEFSFLLHGDQGTSLANWMDAKLAPGYGLELAFLNSALQHPGSGMVNVVGLPHAHHPKGETENFKLGIEMFALLMDLVDPKDDAPEQFFFDDTWLYFSPTKLGLKRVAIKRPAKTKFYAPLNQMAKKQEVVAV